MKSNINLKKNTVSVAFGLTMVVFIAIGICVVTSTWKKSIEATKTNAIVAAQTIATALNNENLKSLNANKSDEETDTYKKNQKTAC